MTIQSRRVASFMTVVVAFVSIGGCASLKPPEGAVTRRIGDGIHLVSYDSNHRGAIIAERRAKDSNLTLCRARSGYGSSDRDSNHPGCERSRDAPSTRLSSSSQRAG